MRIKIKFFSLLREEVGISEREIEVKEGLRIRDIFDLLEVDDLRRRVNTGGVLISRNFEYSDPDIELREGDEIALFPPVSGG